jgi:hypothetical protein
VEVLVKMKELPQMVTVKRAEKYQALYQKMLPQDKIKETLKSPIFNALYEYGEIAFTPEGEAHFTGLRLNQIIK